MLRISHPRTLYISRDGVTRLSIAGHKERDASWLERAISRGVAQTFFKIVSWISTLRQISLWGACHSALVEAVAASSC